MAGTEGWAADGLDAALRHVGAHRAADRSRPGRDAVARGELVVLPTDTVYGLGTDAFTPDAVARCWRPRAAAGHAGAGAGRLARGRSTASRPASRDGADLVEAFWPGGTDGGRHRAAVAAVDLGDTGGTVVGPDAAATPVAIELLQGHPARWP
jgi:hypothetical protein